VRSGSPQWPCLGVDSSSRSRRSRLGGIEFGRKPSVILGNNYLRARRGPGRRRAASADSGLPHAAPGTVRCRAESLATHCPSALFFLDQRVFIIVRGRALLSPPISIVGQSTGFWAGAIQHCTGRARAGRWNSAGSGPTKYGVSVPETGRSRRCRWFVDNAVQIV